MCVSVCSVDFCMFCLGAGVVHIGGAFITIVFSFRKSIDLGVCFPSSFHIFFSLFRYSPFYFVLFPKQGSLSWYSLMLF